MKEPITITHRVIPAEAATELGMTKDEAADLQDVALACAAVAVFLAGIGALLLILNSLFGVLS